MKKEVKFYKQIHLRFVHLPISKTVEWKRLFIIIQIFKNNSGYDKNEKSYADIYFGTKNSLVFIMEKVQPQVVLFKKANREIFRSE